MGPGSVSAQFIIPLINVGDRIAQHLRVEWSIRDTGDRIKSPDEWYASIGQPTTPDQEIRPGQGVLLNWPPDIGAKGIGTLELGLKVRYVDAESHQPIEDVYRWFADYSVPAEGQIKRYLLSPAEDNFRLM